MRWPKQILSPVTLWLICIAWLAFLTWSTFGPYRGSIIDLTGYTGKVGQEDVNWGTAGVGADETFSVTGWSGAVTLTKIHAAHLPFKSVAFFVDDLVDGGYDVTLMPLLVDFETTNATDYVLNSRTSLDAFNLFRIRADGLHEWGSGGGATDTTFGRAAANLLEAGSDDVISAPGGLRGKETTSNVTNPPTSAELVALFGDAATVGDGYCAIVDDSDSVNNYMCCTSNGLWTTAAFAIAP
jgi:hypothetical protein